MKQHGSWSGCSDARLVEGGVGGCSDALAELYRRYSQLVGKILCDDVADPQARLDIHQSVFERALFKLHTLRDPGSFRPWISQITRRAIIDHYRATTRRSYVEFDEIGEAKLASTEPSPSDWAEMRGLARDVGDALASLSTRDAAVLAMSATGEMTCEEIATQLGIKPTNARVVMHRARNRLRAQIATSQAQVATA